MLPVANLHKLYDTTVEFFSLRTPSTQSPTTPEQHLRGLTPVTDPVARLTREPCQNPVLPQPSMRRELSDVKKELSWTKQEMTRLEERCKVLEGALKEAREMVRIRDLQLERLQSRAASPMMMMERRCSGSESLDSMLMGQPEDEMYMVEELAQRRSSEAFLTRTDGGWSGAQVLQAVHDLNSEILQFSATATELCRFQKSSQASPTKLIQATRDTASRMGQTVAQILSTRDHSQDPILVQLVLQGCVVGCIRKALSSFCMGFPTKHDAILSQIYSHIYVANPQPTSSRWRALTHRFIHRMYPYLSDYAINDLASSIYRWAADILIISGNTAEELASREGLKVRFGDQVRRIAKAVSKLARLTREEIMSTNFDLVSAGHGDTFDDKRMLDVFGDYGTSRGSILATTELGLRCTTRKPNRESGKEEDGLLETRLLLQPRVVLDSVLEFVT